MSESPKSRMFEFAAMLNWAKHWAGCRHVLTLLVIALFLGTWCETASAQPDIVFGDDQMIRRIVFDQSGLYDDSRIPGYDIFEPNDVAAITRVVDYLNDLVLVPRQGWGDYVIEFRYRGMPHLGEGAGAHAGGGHGVCFGPYRVGNAAPSSQANVGTYFETTTLHELGHVLGMMGSSPGGGATTRDAGGVTYITFATVSMSDNGRSLYRWYDPATGTYTDIVAGQEYVLSQDTPFVYFGYSDQNVVNVFGDVWAGGTPRGIAVDSNPTSIGTFGHPWDPTGSVMTYRSGARAFYSQVELALMQDLGHTVDISRFFGSSLYWTHAGTIENYNGFNGDGIYGVGLHIARSDDQVDSQSAGNTVIQYANLIASGLNGAGIRVEGSNHNVTIAEGVVVAGSGEQGIGVIITDQKEDGTSNASLTNYGTIAATGLNGTGVWFNSDVLAFDNYGTIFAARLDAQGNPMLDGMGRLMLNDAIFIDNKGGRGGWGPPDEDGWMWWTRLAPRVGAINLHGDTHIIGNIVNTSNFAGTTQTVEISGGNATIHGTVRGFAEGVVVRSDGGIGAGLQGDYGILGTVTNVFGELVVEGDLLMEGGSTLLVNLGEDGFSSDLIVVNGTATLGSPQGVDPNTGLLTNGIYIQLMSLFAGQYTLLTANTLDFTRVNEPFGVIAFLNEDGEDISIAGVGGGRKVALLNLIDTRNTLELSVEITTGIISDNLRINWTGAVNNTWIDYYLDDTGAAADEQLENWSRGGSLFFVNGDGVIFNSRASHFMVDEDGDFILDVNGMPILLPDDPNIIVDNTHGNIVVADMRITGDLDWAFGGGTITGDATQSNLVDATGMLTMAGTGTVTLDSDTTFLGNGDPMSNPLGIGATISSGTLVLNAEHTFGNNDTMTASAVDVLIGRETVLVGTEQMLVGWDIDPDTLELIPIYVDVPIYKEVFGTLQIGTGGTTGNLHLASGNIENHGEIVYNRSDRIFVDYNIFGTGGLTQKGGNELILRGDGTRSYTYGYGGATTVENGSLLVSNLVGTNALNVGSGAVFKGLYDTTEVAVNGLVHNLGSISDVATLRASSVYNLGLMEKIGTMDVSGVLANSGIISNVEKIIAGETANYNVVAMTNTSSGRILDVNEIHANGFINQGYMVSGENMLVRMARAPDPEPILLPRGTFVNDRGTLAVGTVNAAGNIDGVGTLTVDGNFRSVQGVFNIYVDENTGGNSKINVVNGSALIEGGRVNVLLEGKPIELNKEYVFLDVDGGQLNVYQELVGSSLNDPLVQLNLVYDENSYWISLSRTFIYTGEGDTTNQRTMGKYADFVGADLFAGNPNGDMRNVLLALDNARLTARTQMNAMSTMSVMSVASEPSTQQVWSTQNEPLNYALDQMSGSIYATETTASFQNMVMMHTSLANVLRRDYNTINAINAYYGMSNPVPTGNLWGMIYGHAGSSKYDGNVNGYRQGFHGIMAGVDRLNDRRLRLGLFLSAGNGSLSSNLRDRSLSSEFMLGHYVRRDTNHGYLLFQAGLGNHRYETRRELTFINRTANNQHGAFLITAHAEAGLRYRNSVLNLSPFVGAQFTGLVREGFTERNAGSLNLTADMEGYNSFRTMFGMRFDSVPLRVRNGLASFYGNVAWMYEFESGDRHTKFSARFTDAGLFSGQSFTVHGNDPGRDWVQAGFGLNFDFNSRLRGFTGYDAYANQQQVIHSGNLGIIWQK